MSKAQTELEKQLRAYTNKVSDLQKQRKTFDDKKAELEKILVNNNPKKAKAKEKEWKEQLENYDKLNKKVQEAIQQERAALQKYRATFIQVLKGQMIDKDLSLGPFIPDNLDKYPYLGLPAKLDAPPTFDSYLLKWNEIDLGNKPVKLGEGSFGTVYKAFCNGTEVAVKTLKKNPQQSPDAIKSEAEMLSTLVHENILRFLGIALEDDKHPQPALVTEYASRKSLDQMLFNTTPPVYKFTFRRKMTIANEICNGMNFLHAQNINHLDLKTANILLDDEFHIRIADFGLSRVMGETGVVSGEGVGGTPVYMAPELFSFSKSEISKKCDLYSFGVVLWEMVFERKPEEEYKKMLAKENKKLNEMSVFAEWLKDEKHSLPLTELDAGASEANGYLKSAIEGCLKKNPDQRAVKPPNSQTAGSFDVMCEESFWTTIIAHATSNGYRKAEQLWKSVLSDKEAKAVIWDDFIRGFLKNIKKSSAITDLKDTTNPIYKSIMALKALLEVDLTHDQTVSEDAFNRYLSWFPFNNSSADLENAYQLVIQPWWFGNITQIEATNCLNSAPKWSFLIRYSSTEAKKFTVSYVREVEDKTKEAKKGVKNIFLEIVHRRFSLKRDDPMFLVGKKESSTKKAATSKKEPKKEAPANDYSLVEAVNLIITNKDVFPVKPTPCPNQPTLYSLVKDSDKMKAREDHCYGADLNDTGVIDDTTKGQEVAAKADLAQEAETFDPTWIPPKDNTDFLLID